MRMSGHHIPVDLHDIVSLTRQAGIKVRNLFGTEVSVMRKIDDSPSTEADQSSNDVLLKGLSVYGFPILSEESIPAVGDGRGYMWIIDPLDGTKSFLEGTTDFSVMVGLIYNGRPVLGVVYEPCADQVYVAKKGGGAFVENAGGMHKIVPSNVARIHDAMLAVSTRARTIEDFKLTVARFRAKKTRYINSNGIKLCGIADGSYDVFFNPSGRLGQWDYCAPHIILEEAGGRISHLDGSEVMYGDKWKLLGIVASNGMLHNEALDTLKSIE